MLGLLAVKQDRFYPSDLPVRDQSYKLVNPIKISIKIPIKIMFVFYQIISVDCRAGLCCCTQEPSVVTWYGRIYMRAWMVIVTHRLTVAENTFWRISEETQFFSLHYVLRETQSLLFPLPHRHLSTVHHTAEHIPLLSLLPMQQKFSKLHIGRSWILELVKQIFTNIHAVRFLVRISHKPFELIRFKHTIKNGPWPSTEK